MTSRLLLNLVLLAALVALGLYAYLRPGENARKEQIEVTSLTREQVDHIKLHRRDAFDVEMEKRGSTWHMVHPYRTRVNQLQVDRLLDLTDAKASGKLPAENTGRYGVDSPLVVLTLNDQSFSFGTINDITNEQYLGSGETIFLVKTYYGYNMPLDLKKLISNKLLGEDEKPVAFDFGQWRAVKSDKGAWALEGNWPGNREMAPSADALNVWAAEWQLASALSAAPFTGNASGPQVSVRLADGSHTTFRVLANDSDVRLLRVEESVIYQLGAEAGGRLLNPFRVAEK